VGWRCSSAPSGRSNTDIAAEMGVSRQALSNVLNGHASLSADMALHFERAFNLSADALMRMQMSYELARPRMQFYFNLLARYSLYEYKVI
jgi:addiction module HigA family antidote